MASPFRDRFFAALARIGSQHPKRSLVVAGLVMAACGALIPGLGVSTSRYGLVAEDDPVQGRLIRFFERFGYPDSPLIVIEHEDPQLRRNAVDALVAELETVPELKGRVLGRVGPREAAEVVLLQRPEMLTTLSSSLADGRLIADVVEGGLPSILETTSHQLNTLALTMQTQIFMPIRTITPDKAIEILDGLTSLAKAATATLNGKDLWHELLTHNSRSDINWAGVDKQGYLVGSEGGFNIIALFPSLPDDEVSKLEPLVHEVRAIRDRVMAAPELSAVTADVTGVPTLAVDEMQVLRDGVKTSSLATTIGVLALFLFAFRSIRNTLLAGLPLLIGICTSLAIARLLYGGLNLVTSGAISVLMGLGIDFSVHTLARYNETRREGQEPTAAIASAITRSGPAITTGALTTALAFLTTMTVDFTAYSELGVVTAVGLVVMLLSAFLVIPPLIAIHPFFRASHAPEVPGVDKLPAAIAARPRLWLALAAVVTAACAFGITQLRFNSRYFDFLPENTESSRALRVLEFDRGMSPLYASLAAEGIEEARQLAEQLRTLPEVGGVQSASDLLPPLSPETLTQLRAFMAERHPDFAKLSDFPATAEAIVPSVEAIMVSVERIGFSLKMSGRTDEAAQRARAALDGFRERLTTLPDHGTPVLKQVQKQLADVAERGWRGANAVAKRGSYSPEDLPEIMRVRFGSHDLKAVALYVFPSGNVWDPEFADSFASALEAVDPEATGFVITTHHHAKMITSGFRNAAMYAGVLVLLMLLWDFRKLSDALLAMLPLGVGWVWMLGLMGGAGITFNVANIVALPLVLGIGIDAGVHIVHRSNESARTNGGVGRLDELLRGTGGAVFLSSITTMAGFAGLSFSQYGAMTSLSIAMLIGVGTCLLASLVLLPAVLVLIGRVG